MMNINNLPEYAYEYPYIVYRVCDNENWFWGAYDNIETAKKASIEIEGFVAYSSDIKNYLK